MGQGVDPGRGNDRLAQAFAAEGTQVLLLGEAVDRGAYLFVDRAEPQNEQGLREAVRNERGVHLGGYEPPDGEALGTRLRVFRQFQDDAPPTTSRSSTLPTMPILALHHNWGSNTRNGSGVMNKPPLLVVACNFDAKPPILSLTSQLSAYAVKRFGGRCGKRELGAVRGHLRDTGDGD